MSLGWHYFMGREFLTVEGSLTQQKTCSSLMRRLEMRCRLSLERAIIRRHLDCPDLATPKPGWGCLGQKLGSRHRNWGREFSGGLMGSQTMGLYCSHQALKIHESEKKSRPAQYWTAGKGGKGRKKTGDLTDTSKQRGQKRVAGNRAVCRHGALFGK